MSTVYTDVETDENGPQYDNPVDNPALYELAVSENPMYATASKTNKGHRRTESLVYPAPDDMRAQEMYDDRTILEQSPPKSMELRAASSTDDPDYLQTS